MLLPVQLVMHCVELYGIVLTLQDLFLKQQKKINWDLNCLHKLNYINTENMSKYAVEHQSSHNLPLRHKGVHIFTFIRSNLETGSSFSLNLLNSVFYLEELDVFYVKRVAKTNFKQSSIASIGDKERQGY